LGNTATRHRDAHKFVLRGAEDSILLMALQDTCNSCEAISCTLCALYQCDKRIEHMSKGMNREEASTAVKNTENTYINYTQDKYDSDSRYKINRGKNVRHYNLPDQCNDDGD